MTELLSLIDQGRPVMRTFTVDVELDPESGWLVAEVRELPGCFSEAPDMPMLRVNLWEAITGWLKVAEPGSADS